MFRCNYAGVDSPADFTLNQNCRRFSAEASRIRKLLPYGPLQPYTPKLPPKPQTRTPLDSQGFAIAIPSKTSRTSLGLALVVLRWQAQKTPIPLIQEYVHLKPYKEPSRSYIFRKVPSKGSLRLGVGRRVGDAKTSEYDLGASYRTLQAQC